MRLKHLILLTPLVTLYGCNFFDAKIVTECENALKERLKSPSGYKRIEITRSQQVLDRASYQAYLNETFNSSPSLQEMSLRQFDKGTVKPTAFTLIIEYDAPNGFGVPIRGYSRCEFVDDDGVDSNASALRIKIDGQTNLDRLLKSLDATKKG
ncbi:hypothetical protein ELH36_17995 [Rhizobium ruizarguesonis]|uniref:hypothetical protein n=1 Tax=Rhizobium ruizarguesonis TaxID=2081791 RepID=UPI00102F4217|nr:hypothetical protein [Rhizobium ruizarguesonis]TBC64494.1 hypothetical protein ELH36_17995 [Rhizobium ruizarguesonis]